MHSIWCVARPSTTTHRIRALPPPHRIDHVSTPSISFFSSPRLFPTQFPPSSRWTAMDSHNAAPTSQTINRHAPVSLHAMAKKNTQAFASLKYQIQKKCEEHKVRDHLQRLSHTHLGIRRQLKASAARGNQQDQRQRDIEAETPFWARRPAINREEKAQFQSTPAAGRRKCPVEAGKRRGDSG